jgi:two-component system sensor histidine kinase MprB
MSLSTRLTLVAAAAVAVAIALSSAGVYVAARSVLRGEVDDALRQSTQRVPPPFGRRGFGPRPDFRLEPGLLGGASGVGQLVNADGMTFPRSSPLPVSDEVLAVAMGNEDELLVDAEIDGVHARMLARSVGTGWAVQAARSLEEVDRTLRRLGFVLVAFTIGGIGLGAALGRVVARASLRPVRELSAATEHVATTRDLSRRIDAQGRDELGSLARSFNTMLEALDDSITAQRRLVQDASHELRTPLTSLRTNVEVLERVDELSPEERERLLADVVAQLEELTALVADVVELARGNELRAAPADVRLDLLVEEAVERARRHAPGVRFETRLEPAVVRADAPRLARAVGNLLENAAKWTPPDEPVEVAVRAGEVVVRDHGPGIAPADLPHVFDRFYRAAAARGTPGSGLGLAIVKDVVEAHGGSVAAEPAPGGGALLRVRLA